MGVSAMAHQAPLGGELFAAHCTNEGMHVVNGHWWWLKRGGCYHPTCRRQMPGGFFCSGRRWQLRGRGLLSDKSKLLCRRLLCGRSLLGRSLLGRCLLSRLGRLLLGINKSRLIGLGLPRSKSGLLGRGLLMSWSFLDRGSLNRVGSLLRGFNCRSGLLGRLLGDVLSTRGRRS